MSHSIKNNSFNFLVAETAIAIFSEIDDRTIFGKEEKHPAINAWRGQFGTANARYWALAVAETFESVWSALPEDLTDGVAWDWEWIPAMLDLVEFGEDDDLPEVDREKMMAESIRFLTEFQARFEFEAFRNAVNMEFERSYCTSINDLGVDEERLRQSFDMKEKPGEFVKWFGEKYDLTTREEWERGG